MAPGECFEALENTVNTIRRTVCLAGLIVGLLAAGSDTPDVACASLKLSEHSARLRMEIFDQHLKRSASIYGKLAVNDCK